MDDDIDPALEAIPDLTREGCISLLEGIGIVCYERESTADLREAVSVNYQDGDICAWDILELL